MKVLVVGEAPSRWMEQNGIVAPLPLARRELAALAGITPMRFDELFECANVLDEWPGKQGKGDAFPLTDETKAKAHFVVRKFRGTGVMPGVFQAKVILLGRRVERAFSLPEVSWFEWRFATLGCGSFHVATCPHPSGVSTWWNKPENRIAARIFWHGLTEE